MERGIEERHEKGERKRLDESNDINMNTIIYLIKSVMVIVTLITVQDGSKFPRKVINCHILMKCSVGK